MPKPSSKAVEVVAEMNTQTCKFAQPNISHAESGKQLAN